MSVAKEAQALIAEELRRAELPVASRTREALSFYVERIARWARRVRVTGSRDLPTLISRQLVDAFYLAPLLRDDHRAIVDVGAGAGLPGIPLAMLFPERRVYLVEAKGRKCSFMRSVTFSLNLKNVEVIEGRIEAVSLPPLDAAISKATWAPAVWLERASPLLRPRGAIFVFATDAGALPERPPMSVELDGTRTYTLSGDGAPRIVARYTRSVDTDKETVIES